MKGDLPRTQWLAGNAGPRTNGITGDSQTARYDNAWVGGTGREGEQERSVVDRKQLDFGVACRAGNANRFCESERGGGKEREKGRKREKRREKENSTARGSQTVPLL